MRLRNALHVIDKINRPRPLEYCEHTGFELSPEQNELQKDLNMLKKFTDENLMTINEKKTHIMKFNFRKSLDFPAIFRFENGAMLNVVSETKILGILISEDLKWSAHVNFMLKRANKKIWILRRMKILNLDPEILTDFYCKEIRSILEFGVAVWHSGITVKHSQQLETVQKVCLNIILKELPCKHSY